MTAATPGQTIGPFFGYALPFAGDSALVATAHPDAIRLHGLVLDGHGEPVPDALVELWQTAADGAVVQQPGSLHRDGWTFTGWGRAATDAAGHYSFSTVRPGRPRNPASSAANRVSSSAPDRGPGSAPGSAPFFAITVFARGLLDRLFTRAYLPDDERLAGDPLLCSLPAERRATLIATPDIAGLRFDIVLQGTAETVFLRYRGHPVR